MTGSPLAVFHPAVQRWFSAVFAEPTPAQAQGWEKIARGEHTLILAPTGSGKTLAAFLACLDRVMEHQPERWLGCDVEFVRHGFTT